MKRLSVRIGIFLFFISLIYILPLFVYSYLNNFTWRLDSDYDSVWSYYEYVISYVLSTYQFPIEHSLAGMGIPLRGDPFFPFFNPFIALPFFLFNFEIGMWIFLLFTVFFSGLTAFILLRSFDITKGFSIWGALIYMFSGTLAARVAAGHATFVSSFAVFPLILYFAFQPSLSILSLLLFSGTLSLLFLSGDLYSIGFALFFVLCIRLWFLVTGRLNVTISLRQLFVVGCGTLLACSPKLFFITLDNSLLRDMTRYFEGSFGQGSIHLPFTLLPFLIPWRVDFYDRPVFQRLFGFYFNWYEYYAFLTPLPFYFLLYIKRIKKQHRTILILLLSLGFLYIAQKFLYSPFNIPFRYISVLSVLRVPQRMYIPLTPIVILALTLSAQAALRTTTTIKKTAVFLTLMGGTLLWLYITNIQTMSIGLEKRRTQEENTVKAIKQYDSGNYFVLNLLCCNQKFFVEQQIPLINFYSATQSKKTPTFVDPKTGTYHFELLSSVRPTYILATSTQSFEQYNYKPVLHHVQGVLWKTDEPTIFPPLPARSNR